MSLNNLLECACRYTALDRTRAGTGRLHKLAAVFLDERSPRPVTNRYVCRLREEQSSRHHSQCTSAGYLRSNGQAKTNDAPQCYFLSVLQLRTRVDHTGVRLNPGWPTTFLPLQRQNYCPCVLRDTPLLQIVLRNPEGRRVNRAPALRAQWSVLTDDASPVHSFVGTEPQIHDLI